MEHIEVLERLRDRWAGPGERVALDAAIASLSAQQPPAEVQPVGEAGSLPGSNGGFTTAVFKASDVPVGTKLYTAPPSAPVGVEGLVAKWRIEDVHDGERTSFRSASICADELEAALSQQPAAVDEAVFAGEVRFNSAFFVSRTGGRVEQLTTYEDYVRNSAALALMDLGQQRASAKKLTKKNGGHVVLAWVTAPQPVECDEDHAAQPGGSDNDR